MSNSIRDRIIHLLGMYPILSPSMLQVGLGPNLPPKEWRPVLAEMLEDKTVTRLEIVAPTPFGQHRTYTQLSLTKKA